MTAGRSFGEDIKLIIRVVMQGAEKAIAGTKNLKKSLDKDLTPAVKKVKKNMDDLNGTMSGMRKGFPVWAMSIMFFGMAIRRLFDVIWREATNTFNQVMSRVEGTVTGFTILNDELTWLKFVAGQALEPTAYKLAEIVRLVAEWVENNQELTAQMVEWAGILGTVFSLVGTLALGWAAIKQVVKRVIGFFGAFGSKGSVGKATTWLEKKLGIGLPKALGRLSLWLTLAIASWKTDFGGFKTFLIETFEIAWVTITEVFKDFIDVFDGLWGILIAFMEGDWDKLFENMGKVVVGFVKGVTKLMVGLGAIIINVFVFAIRLVTQMFFTGLDGILWGIQKVAEQLDKVFGSNLAQGVQKARNDLGKIQATITPNFITADRVKGAIQAVDDNLFVRENIPQATQPTTPSTPDHQKPQSVYNLVFNVEGNMDDKVADNILRRLKAQGVSNL